MYTQFFGMNEHPFSIAPNPHFLYMSERHAEALAHLNFGQGEQGGFILLTGEVGTGKTTVSRYLIKKMPESSELAFILNPALTEVELLASVCDELGIDYDHQALSLKPLFDGISKRLLSNHQAGKNTILLIDEAQHLSLAALEQLRLLTNLETDSKKLLQVILIGQPELQQMLKQSNLRQLAQRITARYHLMPLNAQETKAYIQHRLTVAACDPTTFSSQAIAAVFGASEGIPRLINLICDRALMATYGLGLKKVEPRTVMKAAQEILGLTESSSKLSPWLWAGGAVVSVILLVAALPPGAVFNLFSSPSGAYTIDEPPVFIEETRKTSLNPSLNNPMKVTAPSAKVIPTQATHQASLASSFVAKAPKKAAQLQQQSEVVEPSLAQLIDSARKNSLAYQDLFRVWGVALSNKQASCATAVKLALACVHSQGHLDSLLLNNSPAIVEMRDQQGSWFAVLFSVDEQLELLVGEHSVSVSEDWFVQHWSGHYSLFWQPPANYIGQLMVGEKGSVVQWLESALAEQQERPARAIVRFDAVLKQAVQQFQLQSQLEADGIAGVQTLIKLKQKLDLSLPRLSVQEYVL